MATTQSTSTTTASGIDPAVAVAAYVCGALGLIVVLGISFVIFRRIRGHRARKYIKQQSQRSTPMGPVLTSKPPTNPWKLSEIKKKNKQFATLGATRSQMHGETAQNGVASVKQERLQKRITIRAAKHEMRARQKEAKRVLAQMLEGQQLPGDDFPTRGASTPVTQVRELRRESLAAIPRQDYVIQTTTMNEHSKGGMRRSQAHKQLDIPHSLLNWEDRERKNSRSPRGNVQCEVTVHVTDTSGQFSDSDLDSISSSENTTEL